MANRRMISKRDCERLEYFHLTLRQRYIFEHLMLEADDDGIIPEMLVRYKIFPFDKELSENDVVFDLEILVSKGFIERYEVKQEKYVYVLDWWKRQYIRPEIYEPTICPKPVTFVPRPFDSKKSIKRNNKNVTPTVTENVTKEVTQRRREEMRQGEQSLEEIRGVEDDLPFNNDGSVSSKYKNQNGTA